MGVCRRRGEENELKEARTCFYEPVLGVKYKRSHVNEKAYLRPEIEGVRQE